MAEIDFERRGRPLWLVLLILAILVVATYVVWGSCAKLQRERTLAPTPSPGAPVTAPRPRTPPAPVSPAPAAPAP